MSRPKEGWHVGKIRGHGLHEKCYGVVSSGYWYAGGPEKEPYSYSFWGVVWAGKWTFGFGKVTHEEPIEYPDLDFVKE